MTNTGEVYFALYGDDFEPEELTHFVGIEPTSVHRKALPLPKQSSWQVSSGKLENDVIDIYEASNGLIAHLRPYAEKIVEARHQFKLDAVLQVVLWISTDESNSTPAIGFETEVISFLSIVGASIDIDTYLDVP